MILNKSFGVIYFHFNILVKNSKKTVVKIYIFGFLKNVSHVYPFHTTHDVIGLLHKKPQCNYNLLHKIPLYRYTASFRN